LIPVPVPVADSTPAIATGLIRTPVEDDQLAVEVVRRADAELAVPEQLRDRHPAAIPADQQGVDDRDLGDPAGTGRRRDRLVRGA
jgi:hypothetical protein